MLLIGFVRPVAREVRRYPWAVLASGSDSIRGISSKSVSHHIGGFQDWHLGVMGQQEARWHIHGIIVRAGISSGEISLTTYEHRCIVELNRKAGFLFTEPS
jgi:hypothetical protein